MSFEIQISSAPGLDITCQLYGGLAAVGAPFSATEIGVLTGEYVASVPAGIPYGRYLVFATVGADVKIGSGEILWGGSEEMEVEYNQILGLDPNNPSTTTPVKWSTPNIEIDISGDGVTSTEMQRV